MKTFRWIAIAAVGLVAAGTLVLWLRPDAVPFTLDPFAQADTIEVTDVRPPPPIEGAGLADDNLATKATTFDPDLVDRRELGGRQVNLSEAVLALDVPMIRPDFEPELVPLFASYADAMRAARGRKILPSVNMIDGKAKQFDDGLYAALDLAYYRGLDGGFVGHVAFLRRLAEKVGPDDAAAPFLAAALELAGVKVDVKDVARKDRRLKAFLADEVLSKPIGFYSWSEPLSDTFRTLRILQSPFADDAEGRTVALSLAKALRSDESLLADYRAILAFYSRLTNPLVGASLLDVDGASPEGKPVAFLPASTSRESELIGKLFPLGIPTGVDLMRELVRRIRSGEVDLNPGPESGWYDHQAYALETLLLPEKGPENAKLLLSKAYKARMLDAFKALVTKRRETHARQLETKSASAAPPPPLAKVAPRLRVEPCPSYYLRTSRSYAFLISVLDKTPGGPALESLNGLKEGGERGPNLRGELRSMRELFLGIASLSAEDIGMKMALLDDEEAIRERSEASALRWLALVADDPDLACDTRVAIPIARDPGRGVTRLWATLGVRLAKLDAKFARAPRVRPAEGEGDWEIVGPERLQGTSYMIPVDEFAEVELGNNRVLSRPELRAICDARKTKESILSALGKATPPPKAHD